MKILFVCMQYIHSARWINQLKDSGHEIYVFDCLDKPIHKDLKWTNYIENWSKRKISPFKGEYFLEKHTPTFYSKIEKIIKVTASEKLEELIRTIEPDLVHSLEMQSETYPLLTVYKRLKFTWCYSCWGNDLYYYKNNNKHKKLIKKCLSKIEYVFLECERDKKLVLESGYKNEVLGGDFPGGGGYDLEKYSVNYKEIENRNLILIKGYEHDFGRALCVLEALESIIDTVKSFKMYVYSAHPVVIDRIEEINQKHATDIQYSSRYNQISHEELLAKFGQAKIAIGNNISDGVPNTLLEAIILGAFPIQSNPGGASEDFVIHGENGFLIENPSDTNEIAKLITNALSSQNLLEIAAEKNKKISNKLAYNLIKENVLKSYAKIENNLQYIKL